MIENLKAFNQYLEVHYLLHHMKGRQRVAALTSTSASSTIFVSPSSPLSALLTCCSSKPTFEGQRSVWEETPNTSNKVV